MQNISKYNYDRQIVNMAFLELKIVKITINRQNRQQKYAKHSKINYDRQIVNMAFLELKIVKITINRQIWQLYMGDVFLCLHSSSEQQKYAKHSKLNCDRQIVNIG